MHLARARDGLPSRPVEFVVRRRLDEGDRVGERGVVRAPELVEQRGLHQERCEIAVVEGKRLAQRLKCAVKILQLAPDGGEVEPQPDLAALLCDGIAQQGFRTPHVAGRHRLQGGLVRARGLFFHARLA